MRRALVLAVALGAAAFACQLVVGIDRVDKVEPPAPPPDPCSHDDAPGLPDKDDDPAAPQGNVIHLAVRQMVLMPKADGGGFRGLDLDGVCTCDSRESAAEGGASSCKPPDGAAPFCDGEGGVDNQFAQLIEPYTGTLVDIDKQANINPNIKEGLATLVVYLASYNGKPNDREVSLGVYLSNGIKDPAGCPNQVQTVDAGAASRYAPQWCGHDRWTFDPTTALSTTGRPLVVGKGWVNNGVLVAKVESASIFLGRMPLTIESMRVMGRLSKVGDFWHLDQALFAGRIPIHDMLVGAGMLAFGNLDGGRYLCEQTILWNTVKGGLCGNPDLAASSSFDFQNQGCSAISVGFEFNAESADLGESDEDPGMFNPCQADAAPEGAYACP